VKRSPLKPGTTPLKRKTSLASVSPRRVEREGTVRSTLRQGRGFSASPAQRRKVADMVSIVSAQGPCDASHLVPRAHGGCDHPDCVIPLTRAEHGAFDDGRLDILPFLIAHGCWVELGHAVLVHHYDPVSLAERCTGDRYVPERAA
jgi:hypothetical protein